MWNIKVEQKKHFDSGTEYTQTINAEFENYSDAEEFYAMVLRGVKDVFITMTMKDSNIKVEGEE